MLKVTAIYSKMPDKDIHYAVCLDLLSFQDTQANDLNHDTTCFKIINILID